MSAFFAAPDFGFGQAGQAAAVAAGQTRNLLAKPVARRLTTGAYRQQFLNQVPGRLEDAFLPCWIAESPQIVFDKHHTIGWLGLCQILMLNLVERRPDPESAQRRIGDMIVLGITGLGIDAARAAALATPIPPARVSG